MPCWRLGYTVLARTMPRAQNMGQQKVQLSSKMKPFALLGMIDLCASHAIAHLEAAEQPVRKCLKSKQRKIYRIINTNYNINIYVDKILNSWEGCNCLAFDIHLTWFPIRSRFFFIRLPTYIHNGHEP